MTRPLLVGSHKTFRGNHRRFDSFQSHYVYTYFFILFSLVVPMCHPKSSYFFYSGFATEGGCWNPVVWVNKGEPLLFSDREG